MEGVIFFAAASCTQSTSGNVQNKNGSPLGTVIKSSHGKKGFHSGTNNKQVWVVVTRASNNHPLCWSQHPSQIVCCFLPDHGHISEEPTAAWMRSSFVFVISHLSISSIPSFHGKSLLQ